MQRQEWGCRDHFHPPALSYASDRYSFRPRGASVRFVRQLLVACASFAALTVSHRQAIAQTIARPHASVLWVAPPSHSGAIRIRSGRSSVARGAVVGGLVGAAVLGIAGYAMCHRFSSNPGDRCIGTTLRWGGIGGGLGLLLGAAAGYDAHRSAAAKRTECVHQAGPRGSTKESGGRSDDRDSGI